MVRTLKQRKIRRGVLKLLIWLTKKKERCTLSLYLGAGGGSLPLLEKTDVPERFGMFP
jgi:hypothetical protein